MSNFTRDEDKPIGQRDPRWLNPAARKRAERSKLGELKARMREQAGRGPRRQAADSEPETSVKKVESNRKRQNSRAKGSSFELKQAKLWSKWTGLLFRRTPMSGGWSRNPDEFGVSGDLVCDDEKFPLHFEMKNREKHDLADLITGVRARDSRSIREWWRQTTKTCPKNKTPVLVFKRNRVDPLMMVRAEDWDLMTTVGACTADFIAVMRVNLDDGDVVLVAQDSFFKHFTYNKAFRKALRRGSK